MLNKSATPARSIYFSEEHEQLRAQVRCFVENEVKPHGTKWEAQGYAPRDVLQKMGALGFLGIRYPAEYGDSEMDTLGTLVRAWRHYYNVLRTRS